MGPDIRFGRQKILKVIINMFKEIKETMLNIYNIKHTRMHTMGIPEKLQ